ncbi:MAG TPA: Rrf2 family transcriptional regulator, partial [Gemmatimonadaceae bacterium]|nr:Rrf2 family transcriptional regulator [Gemmatimonadaceae bacterium]
MRITTWAEYGVICALNLAKRSDLSPVNGREIARQERLPADYVEQILLRLRRAGVIASTRGARGGYVLAKSPEQISI